MTGEELFTPGADPARLGDLLTRVEAFIARFVDTSTDNRAAVAAWVVHTWAIEAAYATPYMHVTAPEKNSGKSTLVEVCGALVREPIGGASMSAAALYRIIDAGSPTILLDELDTVFGKRREASESAEALRGVLNAGYHRGAMAHAVRVERNGGRQEAKRFSCFAPKMLAGNGALPDTLASRSIPLRMLRAAPGTVEPFEPDLLAEELTELREAVAAIAEASLDRLRAVRRSVSVPDAMRDGRHRQMWRPLFAIGDVAGEPWATRLREVALRLMGGQAEHAEGASVRVLRAVRDAFTLAGEDRLPTARLLTLLHDDEGSGLGEWNDGQGIRSRELARHLREFGIGPGTIRLPDGTTPKGYPRDRFEDAFRRYLGPESATPPQPAPQAGSGRGAIRHTGGGVADSEGPASASPSRCGGVADLWRGEQDNAPDDHELERWEQLAGDAS